MRFGRIVAIAVVLVGTGSARAATLEDAWQAAASNNLELRLAHEQSVQASTLRFQALSVQLPQVSTRWTYLRNQFEIAIPEDLLQPVVVIIDPSGDAQPLPDDFTVPQGLADQFGRDDTAAPLLQPQETFDGTITLVQPLLRAQAAPGWQAATGAWRAAQAEEARVGQQVRAGVAKVFYGLHTAREAVAVQQQAVGLARDQLDLARRQVAAGVEARRVELQGELAVSRAERDVLDAESALVEAEQAWRRVVGTEPPEALVLPAPFEVPTGVTGQDGLDGRPDLDAAELRTLAAQRERTARDLEWVPTLDFFFQESINLTPSALSPQVDQWRLGLRLDWQLFDGGLRIARSRELRSRTIAAQLLVEQRQRAVVEDVEVSLARLARAERALEAVRAELALAEENLILAERGFEAGTVTFLDLQTARVGLSATRLALVSERADREVAAIDLLLALGRL